MEGRGEVGIAPLAGQVLEDVRGLLEQSHGGARLHAHGDEVRLAQVSDLVVVDLQERTHHRHLAGRSLLRERLEQVLHRPRDHASYLPV